MNIIKALIISLFTVIPSLLFAQSFSDNVVGVTDGDTITVMHSAVGEKVRLDGIDASEKAQDYIVWSYHA